MIRRYRATFSVLLGVVLLGTGWWVSLWTLPVRAAVPVPAAENGVLIAVEITGTQRARLDQQPVIFTATVAPLTATWPITYVWQATGQLPTSHVISARADVLTLTWETTGTKTLTVTANNAGGVLVSATHTLTITVSPCLSLTGVTLAGPAAGVTHTAQTFTARVAPETAQLPITYIWQATGQSSVTQVISDLVDTATFTWTLTGTQCVTVTALNPCGGLVTATHEIALVDALRVYLPLVLKPPEVCQPIPGVSYTAISVDVGHSQFPDPDAAHDLRFNINLFEYHPVVQTRGLITYGVNEGTPRLIHLFSEPHIPTLTEVYMLYEDGKAASPYPVSFLGLGTTVEQIIHTPDRNAVIDSRGYVAMVLYASERTITLKYGREDGLARFDGEGKLIGGGYVVQLDGICVEPSLLALYAQVDAAGRVNLPALYGHQALGRASGGEIRVAIRDTGTLMDPRSRNEWWYTP